MENKTLYRGIKIYIYRGCFKQLREEKKQISCRLPHNCIYSHACKFLQQANGSACFYFNLTRGILRCLPHLCILRLFLIFFSFFSSFTPSFNFPTLNSAPFPCVLGFRQLFRFPKQIAEIKKQESIGHLVQMLIFCHISIKFNYTGQSFGHRVYQVLPPQGLGTKLLKKNCSVSFKMAS